MKKAALILFCLMLGTLPALADTPGEVLEGQYLRAASLNPLLDNKPRTFADYKGKPLIINVWASWCGPCREEMGSLNRLAKRYGGRQFNVIGVSTDDDKESAQRFIRRSRVKFENFIDSNVFLENMLGANTIPLTILVDKDGKVIGKARGYHQWDSPETVAAIAEAFNIRM
jgi:thiol-disulfide isomerase/thioredoxin